MFICSLDQLEAQNPAMTGGKGASLAKLKQSNFSIPPAFIITADGFKQFNGTQFPEILRDEVLNAFRNLDSQLVAVRSSATMEDSSQTSWAGQLETSLNVSKENLFQKIVECWQSVNSDRVKRYAAKQNIATEKIALAVVVQKMIQPLFAGVIFTVNPVTNNPEEIMIEAVAGLGDQLVQGTTTPSNYLISKKTRQIINTNKPTLNSSQIETLTQLAIDIETHFKKPQDIEWAINKDKKIWILQSRPITTI